MSQAQVGQKVTLSEVGRRSDIVTRLLDIHKLDATEGVIESTPSIGGVLYWVGLKRTEWAGTRAIGLRREEFDVVGDVVALRLDDTTLEGLIDAVVGPHNGKGNLLDELREAVRRLGV